MYNSAGAEWEMSRTILSMIGAILVLYILENLVLYQHYHRVPPLNHTSLSL